MRKYYFMVTLPKKTNKKLTNTNEIDTEIQMMVGAEG